MFDLQGKRIHFMGCGGVGVSALAEIALARGAVVTGCDREENEMLPRLRQRGIPVHIGHHPRHAEGQDWLVHTSAVPPAHPERVAAGEHAMRRGTFLARLMDGMHGIGVCGTHGKTTTTWILAHLLLNAGLDPTVALGGVSAALGGNVRIGRTACFLAELDESDESFLEPDLAIAVLTNIESDHLAHYGTFERIRAAFGHYADGVREGGVLVAGTDDPETARLVSGYRGRVRTFGLGADAEFRAVDLRVRDGVQEGRILAPEGGKTPLACPFTLPLPGAHNVRNALAAVAVAREMGIEWETILPALATCPTVGRRMERVGVLGETEVYSDYAHHPSEVRAAIDGARQLTDKPVHVAFQPHLYSRTRDYAGDFGVALAEADAVWVADIYPAREEPVPGVDAGCIVEAVRAAGGVAEGPFPLSELAAALRTDAGRPALLICMGAGDIGKVPHDLVG